MTAPLKPGEALTGYVGGLVQTLPALGPLKPGEVEIPADAEIPRLDPIPPFASPLGWLPATGRWENRAAYPWHPETNADFDDDPPTGPHRRAD